MKRQKEDNGKTERRQKGDAAARGRSNTCGVKIGTMTATEKKNKQKPGEARRRGAGPWRKNGAEANGAVEKFKDAAVDFDVA